MGISLITNCIQPDFEKGGGLLPVIVQKYNGKNGGKVLMLGYSNEEAYKLTLETGVIYFWSRSRNELWKKGETSGNILTVKQVFVDCDADTILYLVKPAGPVCHTKRERCFFSLTECWLHAKYFKGSKHKEYTIAESIQGQLLD